MRKLIFVLAPAAIVAFAPSAGAVTGATVERTAPDRLAVTWSAPGAVDVFVSESPDATVKTAKLVSRADSDGRFEMVETGNARRYFLLRDRSGMRRAAERVVPLERGSNFRDVGGYLAAGGKHVRWGKIYRSGATPMLTADDVKQVQALGLANMIDLRSSEERLLAPTKVQGVRYTAIDYSMMSMMRGSDRSTMRNSAQLYRNFPTTFAPQLKILFDDLLRNKGPVLYHCTAGQDRTGFTTAVVLSALGVPRATIVEDYHLSTALRRPEYEMDKIDPALAATNPVAKLFAGYQASGAKPKAEPLKEADGTPFLSGAFAAIDERYGSVDGYLQAEVGLSKADLARLRLLYLE